MKNQHIILTVAVSLLAVITVWRMWPEAEEPLDPPEVVVERLTSSPTTEGKVKAAQDLIRHGPAARPQIHTAFAQHAHSEPEVVAPLIQAVVRSEDYESLPNLFKLMEHPDALVRGRAGAAVQKLMGSDYGFRARMSRAERTKIIERIREHHETLKGRFPEVYKH